MEFIYYLANVTVFCSLLLLLFAVTEGVINLVEKTIKAKMKPVRMTRKIQVRKSNFYNLVIE